MPGTEDGADGVALLAEAAGYLSTLGSNLRARAEALREKRLGRRAPTNALGLRKVVDKLLMICELSRRSLDNVEAGVGRVLTACQHDQRRRPGPIAGVRKPTERRRVGKHILKVPTEISLEHFRSCRVRATPLPQDDFDFYPVYFDCTVLRARQARPSSPKEADKYKDNVNYKRRVSLQPEELDNLQGPIDKSVSVNVANIPSNSSVSVDSKLDKVTNKNDVPKIYEDNVSLLTQIPEDKITSSEKNQKNILEKQIHSCESLDSHSKTIADVDYSMTNVDNINVARIEREGSTEKSPTSDKDIKKSKFKSVSQSNDKTSDINLKMPTQSYNNETIIVSKTQCHNENIDHVNQSSDNTKISDSSDESKEKSKKQNAVNNKFPHRRKSLPKDVPNGDHDSLQFSLEKKHKKTKSQSNSAESSGDEIRMRKRKKFFGPKSKHKHHKSHGPKSKRRVIRLTSSDEEDNEIAAIVEKTSGDLENPKINETVDSLIKDIEETVKDQSTKDSSKSELALSSDNRKVDSEKSNASKFSNINIENISNEIPKSAPLESDKDNQTSKDNQQESSENFELDIPSDSKKETEENVTLNMDSSSDSKINRDESPTFTPSKVLDDNSQSQDSSEQLNRPLIKCVDLSRLLRTPEKAVDLLKSPEKSDNLLVESHSVARPCEESKYAKKLRQQEKCSKKKHKIAINKEKSSKREETTVIDLDTSDEESIPIRKRILPEKKQVKNKNATSSDLSDEELTQKNKIKSSRRYRRKKSNSSACDVTVQQAKELVASFRPKKFDIKMGKMPTFSNTFLETHGLSRISQTGSIIAQLAKDSIVDNAKTDLLSDSSDSVKSNQHRKRKKSCDIKSPKAKRRHLMESARAKRLLLTYSSSDSEDHMVNLALNEIAEAVKDLSPDENKKEDAEKDKLIEIEKKIAQDAEKQKLLCSSSSSLSDEDKINNALKQLEDEMKVGKQTGHGSDSDKRSGSEENNLAHIGNKPTIQENKSESEKGNSRIKDKISRINEKKSSSEEDKSGLEKSSESEEKKPVSDENGGGSKDNCSGCEGPRLISEGSKSASDEEKRLARQNSSKIEEMKATRVEKSTKSDENKSGSEEERSARMESSQESEHNKASRSKDKNITSDENTPGREEERSGSEEERSRSKEKKSTSEEKTPESDGERSASKERSKNKQNNAGSKEKRETRMKDKENTTGSENERSGSEEKRSASEESSKSKRKKARKEDRSPASEVMKQEDTRSGSKTSSISQVDGNDDTSSGSEMGRATRSRASNSSDSKEDKTIKSLTNLKSLHRKHRQRDSQSSSDEGNTSKKHKIVTARTKDNNDDDLLELNSKSSSDMDSDAPEEMPDAAQQNGDPVIGEVARDDLLNDTDSDSAPQTGKDETDDTNSKSNGKARGDKKSKSKGKSDKKKVLELDSSDNEESDNDDLKVRRRKAVTISSDSEAGGSKKKKNSKDRDYEHSKSEDSDDSATHFKKTKRKGKKSSDSDGSSKSSTDGGKSKKKRRRIKQVDSEGSDGSDSENEGRKSGRKNIRKVMGKDQLEEATKKAAREERERVARITERQKLYNNTAFDESGKPDEVILDKVVLDFDPDTKQPLIQVDKGVVKKLKPHQANGIKFMWDACFESVKQIKKGRGSGCILAHCMGLGKTLQVVSLTHTLLAHEKLTGVRRVLVVCPLSTVLNWVNEFRMWLEYADDDHDIQIYELSRYKQNHERSYQLREWLEGGGVCVLGYEMFRNLSADNPKKFRKKMLAAFQESLVDPGPDLVVCDEGHLLKNEKTSLSQSMNRIRTLRRIVLTGTPLQNNLKEYYCMVQFVKPNLLGKYNEYLNRFVNPITNGQYTDSTEHDIRIMKRRSHVLHKMLDGAVQRRDYGVLAPFLPPKHEYVLFITLTELQVKLYQHYMDNYSRRQQAGKTTGFLFQDFQSLQRIWTHPLVLKANSERYEIAQQKKRDREEEEDSEGSLVDFLDDDSTPAESTTDDDSDVLSDASDESGKKSKKKSSKKSKVKTEATSSAASARRTRANPGDKMEEIDFKDLKDPVDVRMENPTEWWIKMVEEKELEDIHNSNKLMLLFDILRQCEAIGDKLLVFSQSLYSLDLIEHFLSKVDEATQMGKVEESLAGHVGSWSPGIDYFRLDGSTSCENRSIWCNNFNKEDNPRARLFLISTRAGGLGINLVAANRVVIFDVSWNPSHDVQSIFRVYRFGQKKPCYVYRFLAMGTMEEKIYERQVTKQAISKRVIDEQQIDRHYAENDLAELYTFQPEPEQPRPVPLLPKDRLFAEMLKEHEKLIYRYHEHDSLLENKEEETLTEEERKAAWEDFENEKNRPPPVPFNNAAFLPQMNGMGNMMAQQQQLMMATMLNVIRKDYPGLSEQQIANILPQILYGEPLFGGYDFGMMQKMRAMTGMGGNLMMNPGAGAVAGAGGGTSALAYQQPTPTWQQQQQMQLQRIQQQQQAQLNSGVKYYSGGLGSRDPLSMALQQKQQREMMLNNTGDRLRDMLVGSAQRPPLPQRPPPAHSGEVVNLDDSE